jgi:hypothetical protein
MIFFSLSLRLTEDLAGRTKFTRLRDLSRIQMLNPLPLSAYIHAPMSELISSEYGNWCIYPMVNRTMLKDNVRDTVSPFGYTKGPSHPATIDGMNHVCVFRHALALDELRAKFLPKYVNGGQGQAADASPRPHTKEVWFAGSHSDV